MKQIAVWDLPLRIFHILLALLIVAAIITAKSGGNALDWHITIGIALLGLLLFRVLWGFFGGRYSRFSSFVRGPGQTLAYFRGRAEKPIGHNPAGALAVLAMLAVFLLQAVTGLFANDDVMVEGPFYGWVSKETSDFLTSIHLQSQYIVFGLIALHILAILYYRLVRREDLLRPMVTGRKAVDDAVPDALAGHGGRLWQGIVLLGASLLAVWGLVAAAK